MISIQIDKRTFNNFINELDYKLDGLKEITTPTTKTELAKSFFTISSTDFIKSINRKAKVNKNLSHVYEWRGAGMNTKRLFVLKRKTIQYGNLNIETLFKSSRVPVPIKKELSKPGKTGKRVIAKNIFVKKAEIMEEGKSITIRSKKPMPFWTGTEIKFVPKGVPVTIRNPGGIGKKNAYQREFMQWFATEFNKSIERSNIILDLQSSIIKCLNVNKASKKDVKETIYKVANKYSNGRVII